MLPHDLDLVPECWTRDRDRASLVGDVSAPRPSIQVRPCPLLRWDIGQGRSWIGGDVIVGFTGTRNGMTKPQREVVEALLGNPAVTEVHHGDCVGADSEFHEIAWRLGTFIVVHPPEKEALRAGCKGNEILPAKEYLARNWDIVEACDLLIAAPQSPGEKNRGGTWWTIRAARKAGKPIHIVDADGTIVSELVPALTGHQCAPGCRDHYLSYEESIS